MIRTKLQKIFICKKILNKYCYEIISNLELMCFINIEKIKNFQKIIIEKLEENNKLKSFLNI